MEARRRFSSRRPSRHPLHGRNDMKTSKKRFSRQKHAHKQRKKGLSCHHAPPQSPQPSQEPRTPSIVSTVFNSPNGPIGPKSPKSHNGPKDGCSPSIPPPNPPTFREEPKEYKPNQRNFHRKQDFPQNCGKPSTEMSLFFFCGSSHSCLPSNITHHPHQAHQHYKTLTKQCVSVRDVREVGAVRLVREEEE